MGSSVRFDSATDYYYNTTTPPSGNLTVALWAKVVVDRNNFSTPFGIDAADNNCALLTTTADGTTMSAYTNGATNPATGVAMTVGTWYKVAYTRNGTVGTLYVGAAGSGMTVRTGTCATITPTTVDIGTVRRTAASEFFNGSVAAVKIWTAALTATEIDTEFTQYDPMRPANLQRYYSFFSGPQVNDESGNGFTLTAGAGGLAADASGPTVPKMLTTRIPRRIRPPASVGVSDSFNW